MKLPAAARDLLRGPPRPGSAFIFADGAGVAWLIDRGERPRLDLAPIDVSRASESPP